MSVSGLAMGESISWGLTVPLRNAVGPALEVALASGDVWRMEGRTCWQVIVCVRGRLWITQERDVHDYVLGAGEFLVVTQPGAVLVQALQAARFQVTPSLKSAPFVGDLVAFR